MHEKGCCFYSAFELDEIKARSLELIAVLSRSAIDAGANVSEIFRFSTSVIREIEKFVNVDQISRWLSDIMHRFISSTFDYVKAKHSDVVYKVIEFVKSNYADKLSLDELARHVRLSRSYLFSVFKEEPGVSILRISIRSAWRRVRLTFLKPVCLQHCGFEDQSYFTKDFKRQLGTSPKNTAAA